MGYRRIINRIKKLLFPKTCPLCNEIIKDENIIICDDCKVKVPYLSEPLCFKCGKEIDNEEKEFCKDCLERPKSYIKGFPAMNYVEPIKKSLSDFKYHNKKTYAHYYAYEIIKTHGKEIQEIKPDVLVPVPIHKNKYEKRGYNQAELVAKEIGEILDIPVDNRILKRVVDTLPQKNLDNNKRQKNLENAFISYENEVKYNKVMLVDDIYTTGATIEACSKLLKNLGIINIYYTSIAIGKGE